MKCQRRGVAGVKLCYACRNPWPCKEHAHKPVAGPWYRTDFAVPRWNEAVPGEKCLRCSVCKYNACACKPAEAPQHPHGKPKPPFPGTPQGWRPDGISYVHQNGSRVMPFHQGESWEWIARVDGGYIRSGSADTLAEAMELAVPTPKPAPTTVPFKVGDKVRCVRPVASGAYMAMGAEYVVSGVFSSCGLIAIHGWVTRFDHTRFELVQQKPTREAAMARVEVVLDEMERAK